MENSSMRKTSFIRLAVAATAVAVLASTTLPANAAIKPADKASIGDDCTAASAATNKVAKGRGVDGSDLTCLVVTTGSYKGQTKWWYKDIKPLTKLEWVASSGVGGGYGTTAIAFADAMKAEGLLSEYTVSYKSGGSGTVGLGYFQDQKSRSDVAFINGFAMVAGIASTKSALKLDSSVSVAGLMREWEAIVVPANSKYKNIQQLLDDLKANPKLPIAGGTVTGNLEIGTTGSLSFEGSTANAFETTVAIVDPTADRTITLPDATGTVALLSAVQSYSAAQRGAISALTDGATITADFAVANNFSVTLGGNRTLANPSNQTAGQSGCIWITQDGTGSRTLAYGSQWDFTGGTAPTLSTAAASVDCLVYAVQSSTKITATLISNLS